MTIMNKMNEKITIDINSLSEEVHILPPRYEAHGHKIKCFSRSMTVNTKTGERKFSELELGTLDCGNSQGVESAMAILNK